MEGVVILGAKGMLGGMLGQVLAEWSPQAWDVDEVDITDVDRTIARLRQAKPAFVINAAAYTDVDGAEKNRELAFAVNETGVRNVALAAREVGAIMVHFSTDYVFSGEAAEGYRENDVPGSAVNVYGESKLAGERALAESGVKYYLVRTAWLYGPGGKNFVDTMLSLAEKRGEISVVNDQWGCPTYTKDVAGFTKEILTGDYEPGVYHAVNSGKASWYEFAEEIFLLSNAQVEVKQVPAELFERAAQRPRYSVLQNTKGPEMRPWEVALDDYLRSRTS